ncbi:MAG: imidazole glycerol phosphate synthase subunit HisF [Spirochaetes bacterium]|nr:imidazole glycerol phosphate synthase subunit HisF [Spirochaetota bacterium]
MLAKRLIPCLDIDKGRVVKGTKFLQIRDAGDPVENAVLYDKDRADELVFLDITASHEKRDIMINVVRKIAKKIFIPFTVGGGLRNIQDITNILRAGADKVSINTQAVIAPELIKESSRKFGSQCVVVAVDAKRKNGQWEVYIHGGRTPTGMDVVAWIKKCERLGAGEILLTSMDQDGTKSGYDTELLKAVSTTVNIPVIASGGAGKLEHFYEAIVKGGADAILAASLFHFREFTIPQVKQYLKKRDIEIRL